MGSVDAAQRFLDLHRPGQPLLQPNAWDAGSARVLESLGFEAIATTSSGFAATLGRPDGSVTRDEALGHAAAVAAAVGVPVAADTESGYSREPAGVAAFVADAATTGIAGCSIEDATGDTAAPVYERALAVARVAAAAEAAHAGPARLVLTARAEAHLYGSEDLGETIARLQAFQEAGADVLFAPGLVRLEDIRAVVSSVDRPVNVLALPGCPPVGELAEAGVARISVGGAFTWAALSALVEAATELRRDGTYGWWDRIAPAQATIRAALEP